MMALRLAGMKFLSSKFTPSSPAERRADAVRALELLGPNDFSELTLKSPEFTELLNALNYARRLIADRKQALYDAETEHPEDFNILAW